MRRHARDQVPSQRLLRVDRVAGEGKLGGPRHSHDARQQPGPAIAGNDAETDEALGELRLLGCDADVAHAGEIEPGADGVAIYRGDDRNLEVEEREGEALDAAPVFVPNIHLTDCWGGLPLHLADVAPRRKGRPGARQDDAAHAAIVVDAIDGREEVGHRAVAGQRVAPFWLVHGQDDYGAILLVD